MQNSDIRFQVQLNLNTSTKTLDFTDTTDYAAPPSGTAAVNPIYVTGYLKVETPIGVTVNTLQTGTDLGSPIIYRYMEDSETGLSLPVDANGDVETGTYTFTYQARVWDEATIGTIDSIDGTTKKIIIAGVDYSTIAGSAQYLYITGSTTTANNIPVTVSSAVYTGGNTEIIINETITTQGTSGSLYMMETALYDYQSDKSLSFSITNPTVTIDIEADCRTSQLTSTDSTTYDATINGATVSPSSTVRVHGITPPAGSDFTPPSDTSDAQRVMSNIWTNIWVTTISTTLTYNVETWDGAAWYIIQSVVSGSDSLDVQCSDCGCTLYSCIVNLYNKYISYKDTNTVRANEVKASLDKVELNYMLYNMASRCGEDPTTYCNNVADIVAQENCTCTGDDAASVEVIAWGSSSTTTATGSTWYNGTGVPSVGLGADDDYYLNDSNGDYYKKVSGAWTLQGNLAGANAAWYNDTGTPSTSLGNVGDYYFDDATGIYYKKTGTTTWTAQGYLSKYIRMYGSFTDSGTIAASTPQTLKTMNLPADTLATHGDQIIVEAYFELDDPTPATLTVALDFGGVKIATEDIVNPMNPTKIWLKGVVDWRSATLEYSVDTITDVTSSPITVKGGIPASITIDETAVIAISAEGTTSASGVDDIICKMMTVDLIKYQ